MADFISFDAIKKQVSIVDVLNQYNIHNLRKVNQHTLRGRCPLPTHTSDQSKESFTVETEQNIWSCMSGSCIEARSGRRGGNILDFVAIMERCSIRDAGLKLYDWFLSAGSQTNAKEGTEQTAKLVSKKEFEPAMVAEKVIDEPTEKVSEIVGENKPLAFTLKDIKYDHPYLRDRGVDEKTARDFGVGFFPGRGSMSNRIVFEIHNEHSELVAYAGRSIDASEPKYKFPPGFYKSNELYNLNRVIGWEGKSTVIVVEGFFDAIKVHQAGYPCVALMGTSLSSMQEFLLQKYFTGGVIMLDGDAAGREGTEKCLVRLGRHMWVKACYVPEGKQPDQLSSDEIKTFLSH